MRIEFYQLVAGRDASLELSEIKAAAIEVPAEKVKAAVNNQFEQLTNSNPELGSLVVVSPTLDPPGVIIATESIHCTPPQVRGRLGKPARELIWATDDSTGI